MCFKQFLYCIYRTASSDLDIELDNAISTLYICQTAVYMDSSETRKQTLKKYLLSAVVPIITICDALGFKLSGEIQTDGPVEEVCQLILENIRIKIEYLKSRYKNDYLSNLMHEIVMEKINPKLKKYITLTDFHCVFEDDF